jgi:hypothetical protein
MRHSLNEPRCLPAPKRAIRNMSKVIVCAGKGHTSAVLAIAFVLISLIDVDRAISAAPLSLHGARNEPYNELADAFLHFRFWIARLASLPSVLGLVHTSRFTPALTAYWDDSLRGHYIYVPWGAAPVLVLLVPLHLLGFEPSGSAIALPFAIAGLGFALAALRVILRQIGDLPGWLCLLAGLTLGIASDVPWLLARSTVYYQAIAGGYCFAMIGTWLVLSTIETGHASLRRLAFASLCFGLAAGSRPTLGLTALLLIPAYLAMRSTRSRKTLLLALAAPIIICFALLGAYNQARFGSIVENGAKFQLNNVPNAYWGNAQNIARNMWVYLLTPPELVGHRPFLVLDLPQATYPFFSPKGWSAVTRITGGLLPVAPISAFIMFLPRVARRRLLPRSLSLSLLVMSAIAGGILLFIVYEFFGTTERYEVDYMSMLLFGAIASWLTLSARTSGRLRSVVVVGGGLLAAWSTIASLAIVFQPAF